MDLIPPPPPLLLLLPALVGLLAAAVRDALPDDEGLPAADGAGPSSAILLAEQSAHTRTCERPFVMLAGRQELELGRMSLI